MDVEQSFKVIHFLTILVTSAALVIYIEIFTTRVRCNKYCTGLASSHTFFCNLESVSLKSRQYKVSVSEETCTMLGPSSIMA